MPFRYLRDPLFLACLSAYCVHRCLKSLDLSPSLLRSYLNDVICIPFWIPIMLWVHRRLGLRRHDAPPEAYEIVIPLVIWAAVFEVILPLTPGWSGIAVADPNDVLCYAIGGFAAARFWTWWYGCGPDPRHLPPDARRPWRAQGSLPTGEPADNEPQKP